MWFSTIVVGMRLVFEFFFNYDSLFYKSHIVCGGSVLIIHFFVSFLICKHLGEEERVGCFALIVFLMSCDC